MRRNMNQNKANHFDFDLSKYLFKNIKKYWRESNAGSYVTYKNVQGNDFGFSYY